MKTAGLPEISVVMPSFNASRFIREAAASVMEQDYQAKELVVRDGGSTDGTVEILQELAAKYGENFRWISEKDEGQSDAINKGFAAAGGDILAWLNADDLYIKGAFEKVGCFFSKHPETAWAFGHVRIMDEKDREIRRCVSRYKARKLRGYSYRAHLRENFVSQMGVFFRKKVWKEEGPLDISLNWAMDYDLWLKFGKKSLPGLIDHDLAWFRMYQGTKSVSGFVPGFEEDYQVARRHANGDFWILLRHRIHNAGIVFIYKILAILESIRRPGGKSS